MSADPVLVSMNFMGNLHQTSTAINSLGLAQYVLCMDCGSSGSSTVVVLRMPRDTAILLSEQGKISPHYKEKLK